MDIALLIVSIFFLIVLWVIPIIIGVRTAKQKNRSPHWMWFGFHPMFGFIACIVMIALPKLRKCPSCSKSSKFDVKYCPYCRTEFTEAVASPSEKKKNIVAVGSLILAAIAAFAFMIVSIFITVDKSISKSPPYIKAMEMVNTNEDIVNYLGGNIVKDGMPNGSISTSGDMTGQANFSITIRGDKNKGQLYLDSYEENGVWHFKKLIFYKNKGDSEYINLLAIE